MKPWICTLVLISFLRLQFVCCCGSQFACCGELQHAEQTQEQHCCSESDHHLDGCGPCDCEVVPSTEQGSQLAMTTMEFTSFVFRCTDGCNHRDDHRHHLLVQSEARISSTAKIAFSPKSISVGFPLILNAPKSMGVGRLVPFARLAIATDLLLTLGQLRI